MEGRPEQLTYNERTTHTHTPSSYRDTQNREVLQREVGFGAQKSALNHRPKHASERTQLGFMLNLISDSMASEYDPDLISTTP